MPRQTIDLSEEIDEVRNDIAKRNGITSAVAMRRAFALLVVVDRRRNRRFFSLGIVRGRAIAPLRLGA
jgi:hypothetical protein